MAIRILADTSSDFIRSELSGRNIDLVPMTINVGESSYSDGIDLTQSDFYDLLLNDSLVPKTSQPSPQDFLNHFEQAQRDGDDMIVILVSGALSGTVQSALTAKELCGYDRIFIVDSRTASGGIQILVREAERMIASGATTEEIVARLHALKERIRLFAGLDTLKYLYRGGRLSRMEAGVGTLAGIRPLLKLKNGSLEVAAKCMGSKNALRKLTELIAGVPRDPAFPMLFLYSYDDTNCRALMNNFPLSAEIDPIALGPTLACHAGTGVYAAVFVEAEHA